MTLFFSYSIFCGFLCIRKKAKALIHILINQFLQLLGLAFLGYAFKYVAGVYVGAGLDLSDSIEQNLMLVFNKFELKINTNTNWQTSYLILLLLH